MAIILNSSITVDETSGLQNAATSTDIEDINDNDITVAAINGTDDTGDLPFAFESRLFTLLGATPVKNAALSGYTGAAGNSGADLITITGTYADLAFTDAQGKALGDPTNANSGSDWSGLYTLDGTRIFLYTDTTNNIVLGRAGTEGATPAPEDDLADPGGTLIFAAYLEQTATGAKVWMVQQEPLLHPDTANPDDVVDMTNHLWVTASQDLAFDFAGLPSGQNGFLMFKAGGSTTGLIVTGMDPDQVPANQADTVNTSQGAGPTTIGTNSQGIKAGEGMIFSFVSNPDARYTVPDLTHGEATNESNILFGGLFAASGATIVIAQATPPKTCAATISAFTTGLEVGSAYYDGLLDGNGHAVNGADNLGYIASITVIGANGVAIAGLTGVTTNTTLGSISVTFNTSNGGLDRTATIVGFEANFSLQYTVDGTHNRVVIENSGTGNSTFDIGGFHLPNVVAVPQEVGSLFNFEDDGPAAAGLPVTALVDEDSLAGGIDGGVGDAGLLVPASASGTVATVFTSGADAPASYSLSNDTSGVQVVDSAATAVALASKGEAVKYDVIGNTLWGYVGAAAEYVAATDRAVFKLELTNTSDGSYTFTLLDQLDHPDTVGGDNSENELLLQLGSVFKVTDKDGDSVTATAQKLVITVDDDIPIATLNQLTGTVDEDGVLEGAANAGPGDGIAGGTGDVAGEIVLASGNVSTLFASGADEPLSYSLTTNGLSALGLKSAGVTVTYAVAFDAISSTWLLTASAGAGNTVFTLSLHTSTGAYAFTLVDQLDHAAGLNENDLTIALGTAINATDFDGDTVTAAANGLVITVNDDTPVATVNQLTGTVDEDGVVEGTANAGPGDGIAGGSGDVAGEIVLASGNVSTLFQSGADEALSYSLTTTGMAALGLMSGGVAVTYAVGFDAGSNTWLLTASAGAGNTVFTFSLHATTGAYAFTLVDQLDHAAGLNENDLTIALGTTLNATDFDGDSVTAAANGLVITVNDDTPVASINLLTGTVDEDGVLEGAADSGPGDGIPGGTGDVAGEIVLASGNVSALFQSGADEPLSYSLTTNGLTALGLKSGGVNVTYATAYDAGSNTWLLTASAGAGNSVFTFSVQAATGAYAFMLLDQLDHAAGLNENDLNIALGTAINATDYDGDSITAAANGLLITVDDDSPVVTAKSNVVYANSSNPTPGGTGVFAYDIGADERLGTVYSSANSDLSVSMGDSTVGTTAISNKVVTWASESDTSAVFNLSFTYVSNNPTLGALTNATGTMTFDKVADTYTLSLTDDIDSFSILKTSAAQGFTGYNIGGTTPINQQPPVSVAKLADDFFVQFSGFAEQGSGTGANNIMAGGNSAFVPGELFSAATSWVSVSGTAAGVAGDTIQQGEVMDLDFFTASPFGDTAAAPTATSKGIYVKFDGIGSEDLVLVLKLIDPDDNSQITRAIIVDSEDIIIKNASTSPNNFHPIANPAAYGITLDQNDGAVIIESNDYNFGSENYLIQGLQVLDSTEGVSGSGYNLNGNVGVSGASTGNTLTFSNESGEGSKSNPVEAGEAGTWDGDVIKITDLGFVTSTTPDAHLAFNVVVTDADADSTAAQTLNVTIEGDKTFTGGVGADTFNFSGLDTDSSLTAATTVISSGFTSGVDTLNFPTAGTGANYMEVAAPAANVAAFITAADTALNGTTNYYFGVVGGDGYLAYDGDGTGITGIIKLVGVTDIAPTDIV
ncbi:MULTISPECIES: DUF5801 repeats-in-toxin domain-containing protein [unclassified Pseudomonas]|uniref:beta strand repeat-containing protein n=1 Tax=unclassified Pseudomonas TaxID=196821 RepID=UPI0015B7244D|nr:MULTISPECIES: DUF5801 repeats-in-toxin domain-containing protein [unclassified Pseudomonas]